MKISIDWLGEHLDLSEYTDSEISDLLTFSGIEVEDIIKFPNKVIVCQVKEIKKHPDADKLKVCKVKTINGEFQVVCGAPNAREGMLGIFAPENSYIPGTDLHLKKTKIRGVESCGMLVSEKEMGISAVSYTHLTLPTKRIV